MRISTNPQFVLSNPAEKTGSIATGLLGAALGTDHSYEWSVPQIQRITTTKATTVAATDTSAVRDFCEKVSRLGVAAVMVEEMETTVQHVTTFLFQRSRESEAAVYEIEAEIMKQHPATVLEFHVRAMPRNADGVPELPSGRYFLLTWQAVDKQGNY